MSRKNQKKLLPCCRRLYNFLVKGGCTRGVSAERFETPLVGGAACGMRASAVRKSPRVDILPPALARSLPASVGGTRPAPAFPRRGKRERGRFQFLAAAGGFSPAITSHLPGLEFAPTPAVVPVVVPVPSVCAALLPYALSRGSRENLAGEPGASCYSVDRGCYLSIDLHPQASQPGGGSAATAQSPGCRRRQSVAGSTLETLPKLRTSLAPSHWLL